MNHRGVCALAARAVPLLLRGAAALAVTIVASGCELGFPRGGYEPVIYRVRETIDRPTHPNPPPVVAGFGAAGGGTVPDLPAGAPAGVTQAMVEEGMRLYGTVCSACHGPAGAGTAAAPELNDDQWIHIAGSYDDMVNIIAAGVPNPVEYPGLMPPRGGGSFSDEEVRAIAAYVFALSQQ